MPTETGADGSPGHRKAKNPSTGVGHCRLTVQGVWPAVKTPAVMRASIFEGYVLS